MEEALLIRMRAASTVSDVCGIVESRPAIDWMERQSDDATAFPAAIVQKTSPGRFYDHDGASGLQRPRVRVECFGLTYGTAKILARAIILLLEQPDENDGIRFHRGQLQYERDMPPEDLGGDLKIFRVIIEFFLPYTPN